MLETNDIIIKYRSTFYEYIYEVRFMKMITVVILFFIVATAFSFSGCKASFFEPEGSSPITKDAPSPLDHINNFEDVFLTSSDVRADVNQITVVFTNNSEKNCIYGSDFSIVSTPNEI